MNTTVPASTTSVVLKVQVKGVPQHMKDVQSELIVPTQKSPNNNKGNSNVSAQCVPKSQSAKVVDKAETKEPRRSSRPHTPNRHYTETASIDTNSYSNNLLSKLMCYNKPPRTLQHPDTFIALSSNKWVLLNDNIS